MWPPADSREMPSAEEIESTKREIHDLEAEIERIWQLADRLKIAVRQRREWIAPIKKTPFEILSQIFIICAKEMHFAPMRIAAVCRRWREVVLATPIAWTFLRLDEKYTVPYLKMYIERSSPCLLHIVLRVSYKAGVSWGDRILDEQDETYILNQNAHRLKCIAASQIPLDVFKTSFPNLTDLRYPRGTMSLDDLGRSKFPNLRVLQVRSVSGLPSGRISPSQQLVNTLECVQLEPDDELAWVSLIESNHLTLKALSICWNELDADAPIEPRHVELPSLHLFSLYIYKERNALNWPVLLYMPQLVTYVEELPPGNTIVHNGLDNVTRLYTNGTPTMAEYPNLRFLLIFDRPLEFVEQMVDTLVFSSPLAPHLELFEATFYDDIPLDVPSTRVVKRQGVPNTTILLKQSRGDSQTEFPSAWDQLRRAHIDYGCYDR